MNQINKNSKASTNKKPELPFRLFTVFWISMVVLISILLSLYVITGIKDVFAIDREYKIITIEMPKNAKLKDVASILKEKGVIKHANFFKLYAIATKAGKDFIAGNFEIATDLDYEAIINFIKSNSNRMEKDIVKVLIPEGKTIRECAQLLQENEICNMDEFLDVCNSSEFDSSYDFLNSMSNVNDRYYRLEGYLYPDTYNFYRNQDPKSVVYKLLNNCESKIESKQEMKGFESMVNIKECAEAKGMTLSDLMTLASLIQAEAADEKDMYNVSSVFHNRLDTLKNSGISKYGDGNMGCLSSCATIYYPYKNESDVPAAIVGTFKSKYNTYKKEGLPVGPICSPGMAAIKAALNPNNTDYYYFCHSADRVAYYAKTLDAHNINIKKAGLE